jgi:hypothetical protein
MLRSYRCYNYYLYDTCLNRAYIVRDTSMPLFRGMYALLLLLAEAAMLLGRR